MRFREFNESINHPTPAELMALAEYLLGRTDDADSEKSIPIDAFLSMAHNMGINMAEEQLRTLSQQDPLRNVIVNVTDDEVILSGNGNIDTEVMTVDVARDTVADMANSANDLT
jgi:hypothetical protein|tara:strand:+ start:3709 stop:4050 length:342 start_codon:yes stop_codon:yes gene_type:complete